MRPEAARILSRIETGRIPASSLMRLWSLGNAQARIAAGYIACAFQSQFANDDEKQRLKNEANLAAALKLLGTMGYLRGAIMKVGQVLGNLPRVVPAEFVEVLQSLQFEAPPMHYSLIREVFLDELGREPEEIFASFDKKAFAAASLGQVHKARLADGTELAVKVQYPNISRTIESDLKTLYVLLHAMCFKKDFRFLLSHVQDARTVLEREIDYQAEAAYMEENRRFFSGSDIVVPRYYPEFSSKRVLTMEYLPGVHLQHFLNEKPSQAKRDQAGELISSAFVRSWFHFRTVYSDVHPGNFLIMADGRLGFIDFGCFRKFSKERWDSQIQSERAMFAGDQEKVRHYLARVMLFDKVGDVEPERLGLMSQQVSWVIEPIMKPGPFDFGREEYLLRGINLLKESMGRGYSRLDSFYNWSNRAIIGHRFLMFRLGCRFDYRSIYLGEMQKYFESAGHGH